MPREVIPGNMRDLSDDGPFPYLEVGWGKQRPEDPIDDIERGVSVGIVVRDEHGQAVVDFQDVTLSRNKLNRLIRVLRRARDQAFGADA